MSQDVTPVAPGLMNDFAIDLPGTAPAQPATPMPGSAPQAEAATSAGLAPLATLLAQLKGQAQFLLYLADQIDESMTQMDDEGEPSHRLFLAKVLAMYASHLESKHRELGDAVGATSAEVMSVVRSLEA